MLNCSPHEEMSSKIKLDTELRWFMTWVDPKFSERNLQLRNNRGTCNSCKASKSSTYRRKLGFWQPWREAESLIQVVWIITWQIPSTLQEAPALGLGSPLPCPQNALCPDKEEAEHCTDPQVLLNALLFLWRLLSHSPTIKFKNVNEETYIS